MYNKLIVERRKFMEQTGIKIITNNRKASFHYFLSDFIMFLASELLSG